MADRTSADIDSLAGSFGVSGKATRTVQVCGAAVLTALVTLMVGIPASAQETSTVTRKNIDDLTTEELAALEHALRIVKERSAKNQYDKGGYLWQAWVHNCPSTWVPRDGQPDDRMQCDYWGMTSPPPGDREYERLFPGMCEHGKDLFMPWHRAQLYYFEKILQATDPEGRRGPTTKNVGLPFWNWTRPPSGERYPRAMEDQTSPLYHGERNQQPLAPGEEPYTSPLLIGYMISYLDWRSFGGYEKSRQGGYGRFERAAHNPMHAAYFGGDMASPDTAALDPGFFLFHAYIDLLFQQWIERHGAGSISSKEAYLRAAQPEDIPLPPSGGLGGSADRPTDVGMGQVRLYLDLSRLGYRYELSREDEPLSQDVVAELLGEGAVRGAVFGVSKRSLATRLLAGGSFSRMVSPDFVTTSKFTIPESAAEASASPYRASFNRHPSSPDLSFQMDVYIYPQDAPFDPAGEAFSAKYLAGLGSYWGTGKSNGRVHGSGIPSDGFFVDVTNAVADLADATAANRGGEIWNVSIAITVLPVGRAFGEATFARVGP